MSDGAQTELGEKRSAEETPKEKQSTDEKPKEKQAADETTPKDVEKSKEETKEAPKETKEGPKESKDAPKESKEEAATDASAGESSSKASDDADNENDGVVGGDGGGLTMPATAKRPEPVVRTFTVSPPEERKSTFSKWQSYPVSTTPAIRDVTSVHRRFSDFVWLRTTLAARYTGVFLPPLPPKKAIGRFETDFVEERRNDLERFLNRLHDIPLLEEDTAFIAFCSRHEDSFDEARKQIEAETSKLTGLGSSAKSLLDLAGSGNANDAQLTDKLKEMFPQLADSEELQQEEAILRLREFLTKSEEQLELAWNTAQSLVHKTLLAAQEAKKFSDVFKALNDVESNYAQKPEQERLQVMDDFEAWSNSAKTQSDLYGKYLQRQIKYELEDIRAFLEVIARRTALASRCAKLSAKADKWRGDQPGYYPEKQAKQREDDLANEQAALEYLRTVTNLILGYQIEQVWSKKVDTFRESIQKFAEEQLADSQKMTEMWTNVLKTAQNI